MKNTIVAGALALASLSALAHPHAASALAVLETGFDAQLLAGFTHPFTGFDHMLAMLAAGIWSARQHHGKALPLVFMGMMLVGALSGVAGLTITGLETGIAATMVLTGCLIAVAARLPFAGSALLIGLFALLHGNAHGHELPQVASAAGFLAASGLLLAVGRWFGGVAEAGMVRVTGAGIAATGVLLMAVN